MPLDESQSKIERRSGVALWRQIADSIRAGISSGLGDDTGKLPTEYALAQQFGVNRHTVRNAISALVKEGVVRSEQGRGTFIIKPERLAYPIFKQSRLSTELGASGTVGRTVVIGEDTVAASTEVAEALNLTLGASVFQIRTIGIGDEKPLGRASTWVDAHRFPSFGEQFREYGSVKAVFQANGLPDFIRASTHIEAYHATVEDTRIMGLMPTSIVLVTHAINADPNGVPIEYTKTRFSADRVTLQLDLNAFSTL